MDGGGGGDDEARAATVDGEGNVIVTGYTTEHGSRDYYTAILAPSDGSTAWEATFNGLANKDDEASQVVVDSTGSIIVLGKNQTEQVEVTAYTTVRYVKKGILIPPDTVSASTSISFFENRGQLIDTSGNLLPEIKFYTDKAFPAAYLQNDKVMFLVSNIDDDSTTLDTMHRVDLTFKNGKNDARIFGLNRQEAYYDFYLGYLPNPRERIGLFQRALLTDIYNKIDLEVYSNNAGLKYYFVIKPGGNVHDIKMDFEGQSGLTVDGNGELIIKNPLEDFTLPPPKAYQVDSQGEEVEVNWAPKYSVEGDTLVTFISIGAIDTTKHLVIEIERPPIHFPDPDDDWVTYFGGKGNDAAYDHVLYNGGFHVVGNTTDIPSFPGAPGNAVALGKADIFVLKINSSDNIERVSFVGGSSDDLGRGIDAYTNGSGEEVLIVGGHTESEDFFGAGNSFSGGYDGIIFKITPNSLTDITYIGGNNNDIITDVVEDGTAFYIVGQTVSTDLSTQIDVSGSYYQQSLAGNRDGFIIKLSNEFETKWATYFGSEDLDNITEAALHPNTNNLFIAGETFSDKAATEDNNNPNCQAPLDGSFPDCVASGAYHQLWGGGTPFEDGDAFIAEFNSSGVLQWSSFLGGPDNEFTVSEDSRTALFISPQDPDQLAVMGITDNNASFPHASVSGTYGQYAGKGNFVARFDKRALAWSSGIGCWGNYDLQSSVTFDGGGNIFLVSGTDCLTPSDPQDYCEVPTTGLLPICDPGDIFFQTDSNGDPAPGEQTGIFSTYDGYITKLNGDNKLDWSTYFGGNFFDDVRTIRMAAGNAYLSGSTGSFEKFPLRGPDTGNYQQNQKIGLVDAFLARLKVGSTPVGVEEKNDTAFPLEAFPNPVTQAVNIAIPKGSWQLRLFSIDGKLVYHTILNMSARPEAR
ncbi:MAG: hypothetical protein H6560_17385 [Lewinellaceae bacterium]|nr:hypothetical protein [Lewinellaceae bacterium]